MFYLLNINWDRNMKVPCPIDHFFILLNTEPGKVWKVADAARKIEGVKIAEAVSGQYDVVIYVETSFISNVIAQLHSISGIVKSESLAVLPVHYI
jgi:hypothetical protein